MYKYLLIILLSLSISGCLRFYKVDIDYCLNMCNLNEGLHSITTGHPACICNNNAVFSLNSHKRTRPEADR